MKSIRKTRTEHNLLASFAGESQTHTRYRLFAKAARKEGYEQIAEIFDDMASQEHTHAELFFERLEGGMIEIKGIYPAGNISDTLTNLREARNGEHREWSDMYASYAETALDEGFKDIAMLFKMVSKVELRHEELFDKLIKRLESDTEFTSADGHVVEWMCRECGYVHTSKSAPEKCPVCGKERGYFERMPDNF